MAAVTQYEHDWRFQRLLGAAPGRVIPIVLGVAKAGYVISGDADTTIQPFSGDQGSSQGFPLPLACRARRLMIQVLSNSLSGSSSLRLMKNETDTGLALTIPAGGEGLFTAEGSVDYAQGDRLMFHLITGGSNTEAIDIPAISVLLEPI
jgi:hypothetical protein